MSKQDYIKTEMDRWRSVYFLNHQVTRLGVIPARSAMVSQDQQPPITTEVIEWRKPGTWTYGMRFIIHRQWLCVVGDVGEATYQWSEDISLAFLAGLDFHYFRSKCQASPGGRKWDEFNPDVGLAELRACDDSGVMNYPALRGIIDSGQFPDHDTWEIMCREVYDDSGDAELASMLSQMPMAPSTMQIGHFVGVQMAVGQLRRKAEEAP